MLHCHVHEWEIDSLPPMIRYVMIRENSLTFHFWQTSFILHDVKLAELSDNSFEWKNVTFYGCQNPSYVFPGGHDPNSPRSTPWCHCQPDVDTRVVRGLGWPAGWVGLGWVGNGSKICILVGWVGSWSEMADVRNPSVTFPVLATPLLILGRHCQPRKLNQLNLFVGVACRPNMTVMLVILWVFASLRCALGWWWWHDVHKPIFLRQASCCSMYIRGFGWVWVGLGRWK